MAASAKLDLILELKNRLNAGFGKARQYVNSEMRNMKSHVDNFRSHTVSSFKGMSNSIKGAFNDMSMSSSRAFEAMKDQVPGLSNAMALLANPYTLIAAAAVALTVAVVKATRMAQDWRNKLAEVNVTAQLSGAELDKLSGKLLDIGANSANDLNEVPLAFNRIISAGLSVNESLKALEPTLKAAKAGFTDTAIVAAAGVGVMKSSGEDINVVYDTLFATVNKGNAAFSDIAQYLPKIIPGARQAGFALGETAGAFAYLTAQGQSAEQSTTGLMNIFKALSRPTVISGLKSIGVSTFDAAGKMRPLVDIVTDLQGSMTGLTDSARLEKFSKIGLDMEAAGAFASMTQNVDELRSTIDFTTNSAGQLDEAFKNAKTGTEGWAMGMNKLKVMAIEFGGNFLPVVEKAGLLFDSMMATVRNGVTYFKDLYNQSVLIQDIIAFVGDKLMKIITRPYDMIASIFNRIRTIYNWIEQKTGVGDKLTNTLKTVDDIWVSIKANAAGVFQIFNDLMSIIEPIGKAIINLSSPTEFIAAIRQARSAFKNFSFSDSFDKGFKTSMAESIAAKQVSQSLNPAGDGEVEKIKGKLDDTESKNEVQVNGGTPQKYVNIVVEAIHKGDNVLNQDGSSPGMTLDEFERKLNEICLRAIRNWNAAV